MLSTEFDVLLVQWNVELDKMPHISQVLEVLDMECGRDQAV